MEQINIVFITGHYAGLQALNGIMSSKAYKENYLNISLLITLDNSKKENTSGYVDFSEFARKNNIPHHVTRSSKKEDLSEVIKNAKPHFLLVIGWSELISSKVLDIPMQLIGSNQRHGSTHGCIGMHPTLLPEGRGRAPVPWTIIKGLKRSGVSTFFLEEAADAGGILLQEAYDIDSKETATSLMEKCVKSHYNMGKKLGELMATQTVTWEVQDDTQATYWGRRRPKDGLINFETSVEDIDRLVRGLTLPFPGAFFYDGEKKLILDEVKINKTAHDFSPGTIIRYNDNNFPIVAAKDGIIECIKIRPSKIPIPSPQTPSS